MLVTEIALTVQAAGSADAPAGGLSPIKGLFSCPSPRGYAAFRFHLGCNIEFPLETSRVYCCCFHHGADQSSYAVGEQSRRLLSGQDAVWLDDAAVPWHPCGISCRLDSWVFDLGVNNISKVRFAPAPFSAVHRRALADGPLGNNGEIWHGRSCEKSVSQSTCVFRSISVSPAF